MVRFMRQSSIFYCLWVIHKDGACCTLSHWFIQASHPYMRRENETTQQRKREREREMMRLCCEEGLIIFSVGYPEAISANWLHGCSSRYLRFCNDRVDHQPHPHAVVSHDDDHPAAVSDLSSSISKGIIFPSWWRRLPTNHSFKIAISIFAQSFTWFPDSDCQSLMRSQRLGVAHITRHEAVW